MSEIAGLVEAFPIHCFLGEFHGPCCAQEETQPHLLCTFRYDGGLIALLIILPAYGGSKETAPMAKMRQTKPLYGSHVSPSHWTES